MRNAMKSNYRTKRILGPLMITFLVLFSSHSVAQPVKGGFIYTLSNFTGTIPYNHSRVTIDRKRNEIYVLYQNNVRVFNESGMEVFQFGDDLDLGHIVDLAVDQRGDILLLAYKDSSIGIIQCNFRGEPRSRIELRNLPAAFSNFLPNRMVYQDGSFYLVSITQMLLVIADHEGNFKRGYDLFSLLDLEEKERGSAELVGFSVDRQGNILMTIPVLFTAYIVSPDGRVNFFGKPGSAPGRFNIVAGITRDSRGNFVVVDKLKAAVIVFDQSFKFLTEFGYRGYKPDNLIYPEDVVIDNGDRIYVTQMGRRGVNVYKLTYN